MSSEKRLHLPKRFAELCLYRTLNFDESRRISSFAITMQVIILSGSHWKIKYSTTLTLVKGLVKGKRLSAGESSKGFTFARKCHRNEIEISRIAGDVQL